MKSLFYIGAYNNFRTEWTRYLVSAESAEEAQNMVRASMESRWQIRTCLFICMTPDPVFLEM